MRAVTLQARDLRFEQDHPEPRLAEGEVCCDVIQAGICETDLQLKRGYMGFSGVLGHEFVAVARAGKFAGRRVVGEINCSCHQCDDCRRGLQNHCPNRTVLGILGHDGAFAERIAVPEWNLHLVPDSVSDDEAVFVEPLAAAFQIGRQVDLKNRRVAVVGDGRLAMLSTQAILLRTPHVTVVGKHAQKMDRFRSLNVDVAHCEDPIDPKSFDVVVDCTGSDSGLELALKLVRPRGTVVLKTTIAAEHRLSLAPIVIDEIQLIGSRCGPFDEAIKALEQRQVDVTKWISHRFPLSEIETAMTTAANPAAMKVLLEVRG